MEVWNVYLGWPGSSKDSPPLTAVAGHCPLEAATVREAVGLWQGQTERSTVWDVIGSAEDIVELLTWWHGLYPAEETALVVKEGSTALFLDLGAGPIAWESRL